MFTFNTKLLLSLLPIHTIIRTSSQVNKWHLEWFKVNTIEFWCRSRLVVIYKQLPLFLHLQFQFLKKEKKEFRSGQSRWERGVVHAHNLHFYQNLLHKDRHFVNRCILIQKAPISIGSKSVQKPMQHTFVKRTAPVTAASLMSSAISQSEYFNDFDLNMDDLISHCLSSTLFKLETSKCSQILTNNLYHHQHTQI